MSELSLVLVLVVRMNSGHRDSQRGSDTSRGALGLIWRAVYPGGFVPQMGLYPRYVCTVGGFVAQMGLYLKWVCSPAVFVPGWFYTPRVFVPRWICTQFAPLGFGCPPWAVRGAEGPCRGCQTRDPSPGRGHARVSSGWAGGESQLRVCG